MAPTRPLFTHYANLVAGLYSRRGTGKTIVFILPVVLVILFGAIKIAFHDTYFNLVQEDGPLETQQALTYLVAGFFSLRVTIGFARRGRSLESLLFLVFSLGLFFTCLEEISWGERILHLSVPSFFKLHNRQHEISLHNLDVFQPRLHKLYILVGLAGAFSWLMIPEKIQQTKSFLMKYFLPGWYLTFYFLPVAIIYSYFRFIAPAAMHWSQFQFLRIDLFFIFRDQEPAESLMTLGFLLFLLANDLRLSVSTADSILPRKTMKWRHSTT